jgi:hypothetical protein
MALSLGDLEMEVIRILFSLETSTPDVVASCLLRLIDLNESSHIRLLCRNFYHVSYARPHLLMMILDLVRLIGSSVPWSCRAEWEDSLSIPIVSHSISRDGDTPEWSFSSSEAIHLFDIWDTLGPLILFPLLTASRKRSPMN